jgi:hypothetical protein
MNSEYSLASYQISQMMMDPDALASYSMAMLAAQQGTSFVPGNYYRAGQQPPQSKYAQLLQVSFFPFLMINGLLIAFFVNFDFKEVKHSSKSTRLVSCPNHRLQML